MACIKLYAYCDEKNMCQVEVSNDYFHQIEGSYSTDYLDGLGFFNRKHEQQGFQYTPESAINQGNYAEYFDDGRELTVSKIYTVDDFNDSTIYLNCNGDIINGCDWSYDNQNKNILCSVEGLTKFYDELEE